MSLKIPSFNRLQNLINFFSFRGMERSLFFLQESSHWFYLQKEFIIFNSKVAAVVWMTIVVSDIRWCQPCSRCVVLRDIWKTLYAPYWTLMDIADSFFLPWFRCSFAEDVVDHGYISTIKANAFYAQTLPDPCNRKKKRLKFWKNLRRTESQPWTFKWQHHSIRLTISRRRVWYKSPHSV